MVLATDARTPLTILQPTPAHDAPSLGLARVRQALVERLIRSVFWERTIDEESDVVVLRVSSEGLLPGDWSTLRTLTSIAGDATAVSLDVED
jgi:hypothetical protein